ncbi:PAS domain S-box protein [Rubripirellula reticaptiva]|nr:PAS domain S-box protein [Rubripirellula reticaptiva]
MLGILDTPKEEDYDAIARLAAELCGAPIGAISFVDEDRLWFKAAFGFDARESPRCQAFCAHAIHSPDAPLVVSDATKDPRFKDNPLVLGEPRMRFYAGIPLVTEHEKMPIGTLCVISNEVMTIDDRQLRTLSLLAKHVERLLHLRESSQLLAHRNALIDASSDAIMTWTHADGILSWNRGAEVMYGFGRNEAIGRQPTDILRSEVAIHQHANGLAVGDEWVGEATHQTKAAERIIVSTKLQRVGVGHESVFLDTSRDISEQKLKDQELRRARHALEFAADAILWLREETGDLFYANQAASGLYQYTDNELLMLNIADIDPKMRAPEALAEIRKRSTELKAIFFQTIHVRKDGSEVPVEVASHRVDFENEKFVCVFVRDITERRLTQQKLEEVSTEFQMVFDALPVGVVITDKRRRIKRINPAFEEMFGYDQKDILGKQTKMLYADPADFSEQGRAKYNQDNSAELTPYEMNYRRSNGEIFTSQTIGNRVANESGEFITFVALIQDISESVASRLEAEKLNEERRAMLELLGTTDGVWSWQVGSEDCDYAPGFRKILGFDGDDLVSFPQTIRAAQERIHPDDIDELRRVVNSSLKRRTPFVHEFRLRHADNKYIWVRLRANSIRSDSDVPRRLVGSIYDISDFKIAEAERERFFNAGIQHYGLADIQSATWLRVSENWSEVLGYTNDELVGQPYLDATHPDDRPQFEECMRQLFEGKPVLGFLGRMRHKDGCYRLIEWNVAAPEPDSSSVYFTARDVTDAEFDVIRKISDAVPMTFFVYDIQEHRNVFINRHIENLLGYTPAEFVAPKEKGIGALIHPDDEGIVANFFAGIMRGNEDQFFDSQYRVKRKNGEFREVYTTCRIFKRSADGKVQQIIGTASAVDDLAILRRYANDLEVANEELEEFAYVASHDLKQPLRGIDNLARWIESDAGDSLPAIAREHLVKLKGRVARMERLLDDLLAYSRIGRRSSEVEAIDVGQLVCEVAEFLSSPESFRVECYGLMPVLTTQRIPLEQVFRNLIGNAIKHRKRDDGHAIVSAKRIGDHYEFSVRDDGPGIASEYHERIFRMFHTLRPRDEVEASGMGLALSKKHIESHGGKISVESAEGEGSVFRFTWLAMSERST